MNPEVEVVRQITDHSYIVSVPLRLLEEFSELPAIRLASVGSLKQPTMYKARPSANIDNVHNGVGLERGYKGKGVVVGIFDTGIDPNHINFFDRADEFKTSRVREARAYLGSNGIPTTKATTPEQIANFTTDLTSETHGTHCIGIAAGAYNGVGTYMEANVRKSEVNMNLYGVAPEADIVMGGGYLYDNNIVAGVKDVFDYADANNKPAVVNLSLGSLLGEHDGTGGLSVDLADLGERGIICIAAGNDAGSKNSFTCKGGLQDTKQVVGFSNYSSGDLIKMFIYCDSATYMSQLEFLVVDITTNKVVYSKEIGNTGGKYLILGGEATSSSYTKPSEQEFKDAFTSDSYIQFRSFVNASNYKFSLEVTNKLKQGTNTAYRPALRFIRPKQTTVFGNITHGEFTNYGLTDKLKNADDTSWAKWTDGTDDGSISAMATGENVLVVGAYTSAVYFGRLSGSSYSYNGHSEINQIAPFSSYGSNTKTNETLPHICAPGSVIISSLNTYYSGVGYSSSCGVAAKGEKNFYWGDMQGTSMATPFMTGTVALMLEADPTLTVADVKNFIKKHAATGANQSRLASADQTERDKQWGAGKIEASQTLKDVIESKAGINSVFDDDNKRLVVTQSENELTVFVGGETNLNVTLYSTLGAQVAKAHANDQELTLSTAGLHKGIYVLSADGATGHYSQKILVK